MRSCGRAALLVVLAAAPLACTSDARDTSRRKFGRPARPDVEPLPVAPAPDGQERVAWTIHTPDPAHQVIRIDNRGRKEATFHLALNEQRLWNLKEIAASVRALPPEFEGEPLHRRAWRFLRDHREHLPPPRTSRMWPSHPTALLNSHGFGFCHNSAEALAALWGELGYKARIWWLNGHVVSEVRVGERWEMYDADLDVYYLSGSGEVVGVEELSARPHLVAWPLRRISRNDTPYGSVVHEAYWSKGDNRVVDLQTGDRTFHRDFDLELVIPPGGALELPGRFWHIGPLTRDGTRDEEFINARLIVPRGWTKPIRTPLVLHGLRGQGTVRLGKAEHTLGSTELTASLSQNMMFNEQVEPVSLESDLEIIYLLNPLVYRLRERNTVDLEGKNLQALRASVAPD